MLEYLEKAIADNALRRMVRYGRVEVTYWDSEDIAYGEDNADEPLLRVRIKSPRVARQLIVNASLAVGEGYMHGDLEIDENDLPLFFELVAKNSPQSNRRQPHLRARNRQGKQRGYIARHYDVGNAYYRLWLDKVGMIYSCAYFKQGDDSLEQAQRQKIDHLLRKLRLAKGQRMLDIGCGWGHLLVTAAKQYGVKGLGVTLSEEQLKGARDLAKREGVDRLVRFELTNYQDVEGKFDRIISVGMFEHVGKGNQSRYFEKVKELLAPGGVSVLHTITQLQPRPADAWVDKYIFPGGHLPTVAEIQQEIAQHGFWPEDFEDLAQHYARTLDHWRERHQDHRSEIVEMFDETFYRMRDFWLAGSAAGFRHGKLGLGQFVFTKGKLQDGPLTREHLYCETPSRAA